MLALALPVSVSACAHRGATSLSSGPAWSIAAAPSPGTAASDSREGTRDADNYLPVAGEAAAMLGCTSTPTSPVCEVAPPSVEEDAAFRAEGERLQGHYDGRCRNLGNAIAANAASVAMYRKAIVQWSGPLRMYGVGHAYTIRNAWHVRVARRLDDLNDRTVEEKKRTLRHEMSHTIGATETPGSGWAADDYAQYCG